MLLDQFTHVIIPNILFPCLGSSLDVQHTSFKGVISLFSFHVVQDAFGCGFGFHRLLGYSLRFWYWLLTPNGHSLYSSGLCGLHPFLLGAFSNKLFLAYKKFSLVFSKFISICILAWFSSRNYGSSMWFRFSSFGHWFEHILMIVKNVLSYHVLVIVWSLSCLILYHNLRYILLIWNLFMIFYFFLIEKQKTILKSA